MTTRRVLLVVDISWFHPVYKIIFPIPKVNFRMSSDKLLFCHLSIDIKHVWDNMKIFGEISFLYNVTIELFNPAPYLYR